MNIYHCLIIITLIPVSRLNCMLLPVDQPNPYTTRHVTTSGTKLQDPDDLSSIPFDTEPNNTYSPKQFTTRGKKINELSTKDWQNLVGNITKFILKKSNETGKEEIPPYAPNSYKDFLNERNKRIENKRK